MSETGSKQLPAPGRITAKSFLGLFGPADDHRAYLRGLQLTRLGQMARALIFGDVVAAGIAIWLFHDDVPPALLSGWLLLLAGFLFLGGRWNSAQRDADRRKVSTNDIFRHALIAFVAALVWCIPLTLFAAYAPVDDQLGMWNTVAVMIVACSLVLSGAPLGTLIFAWTTSLASAAFMVYTGANEAAFLVLAFLGIITAGTFTSGKTYLLSRIAEAGMAEKNEVVSLLLREFEENQADWLWQVDTNRRVRAVSPRFSYALGKAPEEIEGKSFVELIAGDNWITGQFPPSLHDLAERLKRRESFSNLMVKVTIDRENRWWELSGTPMLDERGTYIGFRGVGSDVTEQRESSEKIAYLARYDTLTGLPNRLMLNEALGDALRYSNQWRSRCAFLMIDLDRFKAVNDSLGHLVGDQLLAQVSKRLKSLMTENETCGRLGGDEFAIVIRDASEKGLVDKVARTVIEKLSHPYEIDHHTLYVGASVGSALGPRDGDDVEKLMRNADLALYRAKDEGGGSHFPYEPSLHASAEERRQLEFSLRRALERDELMLNFQPVVDAHEESIVSFEALVRWQSGEHGFVSPGKFIPLAEDTRLIVPIGEWVLEQACGEAMNWPQHIRVAVNVSGEQLIEPDFAATVVRALSNSGLPAHRLEIEVTESIFLRDASLARSALEQIMALGCSVALDDFGTGYSSLGYLRKLHFSTIKVDRSFVQGAANEHAESLAIIRAVVAMAQSLGMATTAEGVETAEEAEMIRSLGCTKIQGYYFGRPMPSDEVHGLFDDPGRITA